MKNVSVSRPSTSLPSGLSLPSTLSLGTKCRVEDRTSLRSAGVRHAVHTAVRREKTLTLVLTSLVFILCTLNGFGSARAEYHSPSDSVALTIGTVSINSDSVQDCDSVRIKWWRLSGGWTFVGTRKLTSSVEPGFYAVNVKASDASGQTGNYVANAVAYKFDGSHTDVKTWSWTVVETFDSLTNAITSTNKANFRADVSDLLEKADSALYMGTDWSKVKNQDAPVNLSYTRVAHVDSVDSVKHPGFEPADTSEIKTMNENNQWGASFVWNHSVRTLTSGAGTGANSVVIRCRDSSDSSAVAFAQIQVLDSTESSTIGLLTSDSQGRGFFALDPGAYRVRLYKPGWQFVVPETLTVDGDEDRTYYAQAFDPGIPPQASLCRVYGWVYDINDQPVVGAKIEAGIKEVPLRYQYVLISPYHKSTLTDTQGFWYLDIYPNSVLSPADTKYIF
ncbi:MAG: hypothetical protein JSV10_03125, partial [Candidatus Zixiibacteriota bacterium]